ncbi:MAG: SCP2 sterol-binding domain-containing protein [Gammaproteobacteria bacterium]|nr:SCP2 sterol-binding domain-containing protein [Gammaproteobacteria bacterium]
MLNNIPKAISKTIKGQASKGLFRAVAQGLKLGHKAPPQVQSKLVLRLMSEVLREPLADGDLDCLEGNWLQVEVEDISCSWYFTMQQTRLMMQAQPPLLAAHSRLTTIAGKSIDLMRMLGRQQDPDTLFFQRRLRLSGDTELGLEIRNVLDGVDMDELPGYLRQGMDWLNKPLAWHATAQ